MFEPNENNNNPMENTNEAPVDGAYSFSYKKAEEEVPAQPQNDAEPPVQQERPAFRQPSYDSTWSNDSARQSSYNSTWSTPSEEQPRENAWSAPAQERPRENTWSSPAQEQPRNDAQYDTPFGRNDGSYDNRYQRGYGPSDPGQGGTNYRPSYQSYSGSRQEEPKKKKLWLKVVALLLAVVILGSAAGVGGYFITRGMNDSEKSADDTASAPVSDGVVPETRDSAADTEDAQPVDTAPQTKVSGTPIVTYTGSGQQMSATEIYKNYVNACVGVATEVTSTNLFGQVSKTPVSGSGFVISPDGYIITNCHVVDDGTEFEISFYDGTTYPATLIGKDSNGDVALLKVEAEKELPYCVIGDINACEVGEDICVIGNPLGELTFTLTTGSLSAFDRSINTDGNYQNMFQIDAAINSGNSGGPVFNSKGEVIGVATAKYSSTGVEGLAFALPIDDVINEINDIKVYGYVTGRAYMGIFYQNIDTRYAYVYGLPTGVYVESCDEGGCAAKAGLQHGDIITGIDGIDVTSGTSLKAEISKLSAGDTATLTVYRNGESIEIEITFDEYIPSVVEAAEKKAQEDYQKQQQQNQYAY